MNDSQIKAAMKQYVVDMDAIQLIERVAELFDQCAQSTTEPRFRKNYERTARDIRRAGRHIGA